MKILKIVTIDQCVKCDHKRKTPPGIGITHSWWCGHPDKIAEHNEEKIKLLVSPNGDDIPDWCPLDDASQPTVPADADKCPHCDTGFVRQGWYCQVCGNFNPNHTA